MSFLRSGSSSSVPSSKGCSSASASSSSMSCSSFAIWHMACSDNSVSSVSVSLSARTTWFFRFFSGRSSAASSSSSQRDFHLLRHRLCNRNRPFHIHLHISIFFIKTVMFISFGIVEHRRPLPSKIFSKKAGYFSLRQLRQRVRLPAIGL